MPRDAGSLMREKRPYLAFFRAGPTTVHRRLMREDPGRNWDCAVNWWSEPEWSGESPLEDIRFDGGDNKLEGFARFFEEAWQPDWDYRYVLVADDDVLFRPGELSRFFEICDRRGLYLSQPALRWGTNSNHVVTVWNPLSRIRRVNFVEVMAPCFSMAALRELLPTFRDSRSTLGTDLAWAALLRGRDAIHVVDAVRVEHVRKVDWENGAWYRRMSALGVDPSAESETAKARYGDIGRARTRLGGHEGRLPVGRAASSVLVQAADALIVAGSATRDALWRTARRLRGRPVPRGPGGGTPPPRT